MDNTTAETSTPAEPVDHGEKTGNTGASGLAVGLSIGGVFIAALLVFIAAYCFFRYRKTSEADDHSDNNNVQRISMNSENFSHVTNLRKLEPLENKTGKAIPKRTKPTLDEKRNAGKADDLSDVDLSLFSGEGQVNPAFVDDETVDRKHHDDTKKASTKDNIVVLKLEGVVKFDVSQMVGIDKNIALSLEDQKSGEVQKIVASNGDLKTCKLFDKDVKTGTLVQSGQSQESVVFENQRKLTEDVDTGKPETDAVAEKSKPVTCSVNVTDCESKVDSQTVNSTNNNKPLSSNVVNPRGDEEMKELNPGTRKANLSKIITTRIDKEDVIQVITEDPGSSSNKSTSVMIENSEEYDKSSPYKNDDRHVAAKGKSLQDRSVSVIEKSIDIEDEIYRRKHSVRGKEVTTIYIGDRRTSSVRDGTREPYGRPVHSVTDMTRGRHDKIVFKSNPKPEKSSGKIEHRKRKLESEPPLKGKDMNVPVTSQSVGYIPQTSSSGNKPELVSHPDRPSEDKHKGKKVPTKPVLKREMSTYEIPWDLTDVGALLMQVNSITESEDMHIDRVS